MADSYEELVELGFEGIDRFATKFHDPVHDFARKNLSKGHQNSNKEKSNQHRSSPPPPPPPPPGSRRPRSESIERRRRDSGRGNESSIVMYEESERDNSTSAYESVPRRRNRDRGYYEEDTTVEVGRRDGREPFYRGGYEIAPRAPSDRGEVFYANREVVERPPERWGGYDRGYDRGHERGYERGRPGPGWHRSSSYSPPRQRRSPLPPAPRTRARSKSPNHHRVAATIVGALAGGLIGNAAKHGSTMTTVGGAIAGGIAAREGEKWYDRHEERKYEHDEERARRREGEYRYY